MTPADKGGSGGADPRPHNCRERLMAEGKSYPRSSCEHCGTLLRKNWACEFAAPQSGPAGGEKTDLIHRIHTEMPWETLSDKAKLLLLELEQHLKQPAPSSGKAEGVPLREPAIFPPTTEPMDDWMHAGHYEELKHWAKARIAELEAEYVKVADENTALTAAAAEREKEIGRLQNAKIDACIAWTEANDELTATREQLREREAEVAKLKAAGDRLNAECGEAWAESAQRGARVAVLEEALGRIAAYDVPDAHEMIRIAKAALTPPPPPAVDGRRGEVKL